MKGLEARLETNEWERSGVIWCTSNEMRRRRDERSSWWVVGGATRRRRVVIYGLGVEGKDNNNNILHTTITPDVSGQ